MKILETKRSTEGVDTSKHEANYVFDIACTQEEANEVAQWYKELAHQRLFTIHWCTPKFIGCDFDDQVNAWGSEGSEFVHTLFGIDGLYGKLILEPKQAFEFKLRFE